MLYLRVQSMSKFYIYFFFIFILLLSCNKDDDNTIEDECCELRTCENSFSGTCPTNQNLCK